MMRWMHIDGLGPADLSSRREAVPPRLSVVGLAREECRTRGAHLELGVNLVTS